MEAKAQAHVCSLKFVKSSPEQVVSVIRQVRVLLENSPVEIVERSNEILLLSTDKEALRTQWGTICKTFNVGSRFMCFAFSVSRAAEQERSVTFSILDNRQACPSCKSVEETKRCRLCLGLRKVPQLWPHDVEEFPREQRCDILKQLAREQMTDLLCRNFLGEMLKDIYIRVQDPTVVLKRDVSNLSVLLVVKGTESVIGLLPSQVTEGIFAWFKSMAGLPVDQNEGEQDFEFDGHGTIVKENLRLSFDPLQLSVRIISTERSDH